jgi:hypothetical protein
VKTCSQCKEVKPLESFTRQKAGKDGYRPSCRACCQAYNAEYRKKNAVKVKAYNDRWRAENRERHNAYGRQWSKDNRERAGENRRKWRKNNPEKVRAAKKRYREKNPEKHRALRKREYEKNSETYKARVRQWVKDKPRNPLAREPRAVLPLLQLKQEQAQRTRIPRGGLKTDSSVCVTSKRRERSGRTRPVPRRCCCTPNELRGE